jgi:hypothetical protein
VIHVAAGDDHSLALTSTGQLYAFGGNHFGQLGSAINVGMDTPNPTPSLANFPDGTTIDTMAAGVKFSLSLVGNLAVTTSSLPVGVVGVPYSADVLAAGGVSPYVWTASGLPAGLSIGSNGQISGTPLRPEIADLHLNVDDSFGITAGSSVPLIISPIRPVITGLRQSHVDWREGHRPARSSSNAAKHKRRRLPVGTTFSFGLNENANVRFAFFVRQGRAHKRKTRWTRAGTLTVAGHPDTNRVVFQGHISKSNTLTPGRYKLILTAESKGVTSEPKSCRFTIVGS